MYPDVTGRQVPEAWDRSGLPAWTYTNEELTEIEKDVLFRRHWQLACHLSDVPEPGDYITFDMVGERAIIMRGKDGEVRAFHNLCRHRGSRVLPDGKGSCKHAMVCPFHGWSYNLDGTLRGAAAPKSLPKLDPVEHGLKPIESDLLMGFVFIRFLPGDQPALSDLMARHHAELAPYQAESMVAAQDSFWHEEMAVNWKSVRDVDNEGYHVPIAHPSLQDLYGRNYYDEPLKAGTCRSVGRFTDSPGRCWSVRNYKKFLPQRPELLEENQQAWLYIGLFPNTVISFYPCSVMFYQEFPVSARQTIQRGAAYRLAEESRSQRLARYLAERIDRHTVVEDIQLIKWSCEATESSAYDGIILSDREYNVRCYHDAMRAAIPVMNLDQAPAANTLADVNWALAEGRAIAAE